MIIKESQGLEQIMPAVYNKLKTLGEVNNVVPLDKIIKGLQTGSARAFVSNQDRNQDGIPDNINIVYPTIDIDLSQSLSGITSADVTAFPNVDSQKAYHVLNILVATLEVLQHEQDHLSGFKSTENEPGAVSEEFGSESSAHQAGHTAAQNFLNKWKNTIDSTINKGSSRNTIHINFEGDYEMRKELVKLANHLDRLGHRDLSDRIDNVLTKSSVAVKGNTLKKTARWAPSTPEQRKAAPSYNVFVAALTAIRDAKGESPDLVSQADAVLTESEAYGTAKDKGTAWMQGSDYSSTPLWGSIAKWLSQEHPGGMPFGAPSWKAKQNLLDDAWSASNKVHNEAIRAAKEAPSAQVASGEATDAAPAPAPAAEANDQLSTEASDNSLDGMFSVNPIGLVSR